MVCLSTLIRFPLSTFIPSLSVRSTSAPSSSRIVSCPGPSCHAQEKHPGDAADCTDPRGPAEGQSIWGLQPVSSASHSLLEHGLAQSNTPHKSLSSERIHKGGPELKFSLSPLSYTAILSHKNSM